MPAGCPGRNASGWVSRISVPGPRRTDSTAPTSSPEFRLIWNQDRAQSKYRRAVCWQFAGLSAMSAEAGASPVAASVAVLLQQLVLLVDGIRADLGAGRPHILARVDPDHVDSVANRTAELGTVMVDPGRPRALADQRRRGERIFKRPGPAVPSPPPGALCRLRASCRGCGSLTGLLWLFGRALFGDAAPHLWLRRHRVSLVELFPGLIAVFAPKASWSAMRAHRPPAQGRHRRGPGPRAGCCSRELWLVALKSSVRWSSS